MLDNQNNTNYQGFIEREFNVITNNSSAKKITANLELRFQIFFLLFLIISYHVYMTEEDYYAQKKIVSI